MFSESVLCAGKLGNRAASVVIISIYFVTKFRKNWEKYRRVFWSWTQYRAYFTKFKAQFHVLNSSIRKTIKLILFFHINARESLSFSSLCVPFDIPLLSTRFCVIVDWLYTLHHCKHVSSTSLSTQSSFKQSSRHLIKLTVTPAIVVDSLACKQGALSESLTCRCETIIEPSL